MNKKNQKIKRIKSPRKVVLWEIFLFGLTLALGIINAYRLNQIFISRPELERPQINLEQFGIYFVVVTLLIVVLSSFRKFKGKRAPIFKTFFVLAVGLGGVTLLEVWIGTLLALMVMVSLILLWFKKHSILVHNLLVILGVAGAGSLLGLAFNPLIIVFLLVIFSIYDFIAVYKTKHMVKMAKAMVKAEAIVGLIVPQKVEQFRAKLSQVRPGGKFLILGAGDVVFPLILCASLTAQSIVDALVVACFGLLGLLASFLVFITQKIKKPIPALPPIALFSIIGYLIVTFLV